MLLGNYIDIGFVHFALVVVVITTVRGRIFVKLGFLVTLAIANADQGRCRLVCHPKRKKWLFRNRAPRTPLTVHGHGQYAASAAR
jgi:cytochrome c biogenesis protein ResB